MLCSLLFGAIIYSVLSYSRYTCYPLPVFAILSPFSLFLSPFSLSSPHFCYPLPVFAILSPFSSILVPVSVIPNIIISLGPIFGPDMSLVEPGCMPIVSRYSTWLIEKITGDKVSITDIYVDRHPQYITYSRRFCISSSVTYTVLLRFTSPMDGLSRADERLLHLIEDGPEREWFRFKTQKLGESFVILFLYTIYSRKVTRNARRPGIASMVSQGQRSPMDICL